MDISSITLLYSELTVTGKITSVAMKISETERQSLISFFSTIILTILGFFSTVYFAHTLGPGLLGSYWIFLAYFGVFSIISDGGISAAAVKKISEGKYVGEYFTASLFLRLILLSVVLFAAFLSAPLFVDFSETGLFPLLIAALIVSSISSVLSSGVYARGNIGISQIARLSNELARIAVQVIFVYAGFLAGGLVMGIIAGMTAGILVNAGRQKIRLKKFSRYHIKEILHFSGWTFLSSASACITAYAGTILVGYFMKNSDAGIYTTALQLTSVVTFSAVALQTALYPKISRWHADREYGCIKNALSRVFTYSLLLALPACTGGIILGSDLLYYLYGADFAKGYYALSFLFVAQVAEIFVIVSLMAINATGHPDSAFKTGLILSLAFLPLNLLLIPFMGISGAGLSLMIANISGAIIALWYAKKYTEIVFQKSALKNILISAFFMMLFLIFAKEIFPPHTWYQTLILVLSGALIYVAVILKREKGITSDLRKIISDIGIKV